MLFRTSSDLFVLRLKAHLPQGEGIIRAQAPSERELAPKVTEGESV